MFLPQVSVELSIHDYIILRADADSEKKEVSVIGLQKNVAHIKNPETIVVMKYND